MYFKWHEQILAVEAPDFAQQAANLYERGYLLGRKQPGYFWQTRSLRLNLHTYLPSSENRRVLKKFAADFLDFQTCSLPIAAADYSWKIHALGKQFYEAKFPDANFSANKLKQLLTTKYGFNQLLIYRENGIKTTKLAESLERVFGFNIGYLGIDFYHYCYPFYDLHKDTNNLGMFMLLHAILWAQLLGLNYIYLGGVTRPADKYKLQFSGLEWFDGQSWQTDLNSLKSHLTAAN